MQGWSGDADDGGGDGDGGDDDDDEDSQLRIRGVSWDVRLSAFACLGHKSLAPRPVPATQATLASPSVPPNGKHGNLFLCQ